MITNPRINDYINSLDPGQGKLYETIAEEAAASFVPIIKQETASLLQTLIVAAKPEHILEVGTAVGYSALLMSQVMPRDCHITTIEKYAPRLPVARENFRRAGKERVITLLEGDAQEILPALTESYDFIFMDAAKGQYLHWLPWILERLAPGGMLVSDNVLQDGDIVESRFALERRNRTIHSRMREYLYVLTHHELLRTSVVPIGDGVTISVRRSMELTKGNL